MSNSLDDPQTHLDTDLVSDPDTQGDPAHEADEDEADEDEGWESEGGATAQGPATDT